VLIAAVNASVAALLVPALRGRHFTAHVAVVSVALPAVLLYGQWRLGETFADGARFRSPWCRTARRPRRPVRRHCGRNGWRVMWR
jgi:hypothetical protein